MITTIGVSYVLFNMVLLTLGADARTSRTRSRRCSCAIGGAVLRLREVPIWGISLRADGRR